MLLYYLSGFGFFFMSIFFFIFSMFLLVFKLSYFMEWLLVIFNSVNMNMFIYIDWVSTLFIFAVLMISSMILFYCVEYMSHDNYINRFFYLVFFFILSMLLMILSPNMVSILLGWDGLGLVSYCLVIYYQSYSSFNSGMLTVLMNRIGDVLILMSISLMFMYGSWNFMNFNLINQYLMICVILASFTKSAQFPFSSWLPAAMAAPTPVSSLVHSSTLVTAGIYLLIRFNYLIYKNIMLLNFILFISILTMMMAGFSANFEYDIKKIIAFSTLSQLGLMLIIYSMKLWELSYFHLLIHAMFKSMMFMCSGVVIHSMLNFQDIRFMGMIKYYLPFTCMIFMISNLSLCGLPFMSGFYSKDQILENLLMMNFSSVLYFFLMLGTGLTVSYSVRLLYYMMNYKILFLSFFNIKDFKMMNYPMIILMLFSLMFGEILNWILFNNLENIFLFNYEKISILILCFMFFFIGLMIYKIKSMINSNFFFLNFFGKMWFLYNLNKIIIKNPFIMGKFYIKMFDKGWSEFFMKDSMYLMSKNLNSLNILNMNYLMILILSLNYIMLMLFLYLVD